MEPQKRNKRRNVFIVIAVQTIVTLMFWMFAFYQKAEADAQRQMAEKNASAAQEQRARFVELRVSSEKIIDSLTTELSRFKAITEKK